MISASDGAHSNDGLNCPKGDIFETVAPSGDAVVQADEGAHWPFDEGTNYGGADDGHADIQPCTLPHAEADAGAAGTHRHRRMPRKSCPRRRNRRPSRRCTCRRQHRTTGHQQSPTMLTCEPFDCNAHSNPSRSSREIKMKTFTRSASSTQ